MNETEDISTRLTMLEDIEALKKLKARYFRCLDKKLWDELSDCFTDDATTAYTDGQLRLEGKQAIMDFLRSAMGRYTFFGFHQAHHPEIDILNNHMAKGIWSAHYYMIDTEYNRTLQCGAFYYDEFEKSNGIWKIKHIGYNRIFEEQWNREQIGGLSITSVMDFASW